MMRGRHWILTTVCGAAIGLTILSWPRFSRPRPDARRVSAAEDEVYEVVVRDFITPADGHVRIKQLMFDENAQTGLFPGGEIKSCRDAVRKHLWSGEIVPPYNSLADKIYRVFHGGDYRPVQADTIQDFLKKSCAAGRLSQTFHTDLPRAFIGVEGMHFEGWRIEINGSKSFEQLFPGAGGVISLSHVGFDPALSEAVVFVSYVCGELCGSGHRYILRKKQGRWEVVNKSMMWVS